jgi:hypothetical protein
MPTLGTDTDFTINATSASVTFSHTVPAGQTNGCLVVRVGWWSTTAGITSITFGGVTMTQVGLADPSTAGDKAAIYRLVNPTASTANVVITFPANESHSGGANALNLTDVHQTTPTGTFAKGTATGTTISATATSATGELVLDAASCDDSTNTTHTIGGSQTAQLNASAAGEGGLASSAAGAASVVMSWTVTSRTWTSGAVSFKPATAAAAPLQYVYAPRYRN